MKILSKTLIAAGALLLMAPTAYIHSAKHRKAKAKAEAEVVLPADSVAAAEIKLVDGRGEITAAADLDQRRELSQAAATVISASVNRALNQLGMMGVPIDRKVVGETIASGISGMGLPMGIDEANALIDSYLKELRKASADTLSMASQKEFLAKQAKTPGSIVLPSGVIVQIVTEGEGEHPTEADSVVVKYSGKLYDGREFDATHGYEEVTFPVSGLVDGFTEGLLQTKPGGTYRILIPSDKGYGPDGIPGAIPGNAALDFTVEVLRVIRAGVQKQPARP